MSAYSNVQRITPFLWFENQAEEAARFYVATFKDAQLGNISRYGAAGPGEPGSAMTVSFTLYGEEFIALNGGAVEGFTFSPAISFMVSCETQDEVDHLWDALSAGGRTSQCGWLYDKFGVTWQIVPNKLSELLGDDDEEKAQRVMQAMLQMTKIEIPKLQAAYDG